MAIYDFGLHGLPRCARNDSQRSGALPLAGSDPLIALFLHQLGKCHFVFHRQHEQCIEHRTRKSSSFTAACIGLQLIHQGVEFRATPKQLELSADVRKSCVNYLEVGVVLNHTQFSIALHQRDHEEQEHERQHDQKDRVRTSPLLSR